jgi:hypothetical protein
MRLLFDHIKVFGGVSTIVCVPPVMYGVSSGAITDMLPKNMVAITFAVFAALFVMASVFQFVINSTN